MPAATEGSMASVLREVAAAPPVPTAGVIEAGTVLDDRLRIEKRIGSGGMGVVFLAHHLQLERQVAVKLTHPGAGNSRMARLQREAKAMARLAHENVITVYDVGSVNGQVYIAMEYLDGGTAKSFAGGEGRTWEEILAIYLRAGRGLVAAHEAKLVHRDFKPDNVLLGSDGRVRVADFGLVREAGAPPDEAAAAMDPADTTSGDASLTRTGTTVGTPAYMAPEQHWGKVADEASDQFAFCVSVWEGLYGERPFSGKTASELYLALREGEPPEPPSSSPVPQRIARVLRRGLAIDPKQRYRNMRRLLAALRHDPSKRRRRLFGGAALLSAAVAGTYVLAADEPEDPCAVEAARVKSVWNPSRREATRAAFAATNLSYADDTFRRTADAADHYAARWSDAARRACEATYLLEAQTPEALGLRLRCLARRRSEFHALVDLLAEPDAELVRSAAQAVANLPSIDRCEDADALARVQPIKSEDAGAVAEIEDVLARVNALEAAGRWVEALEELDSVSPRIEDLGYDRLRAGEREARGSVLIHLFRPDEASAVLQDALEYAFASNEDEQASEILRDLIHVDGYLRNRTAEARQWYRVALGWVRRFDDEEVKRALLYSTFSLVEREDANFEEAIRLTEEALAIYAEYPDKDPQATTTLSYLAEHHRMRGAPDQAAELQEQLLAKSLAQNGEAHPRYGRALINAGGVYASAGRDEEAIPLLEKGIAVRVAALGGHDAMSVQGLGNIATSTLALGDGDKALALVEEAVRIAEEAEVNARTLLLVKGTYAGVLVDVGRNAEAVEVMREAEVLSSELNGAEHQFTIRTGVNLAAVLLNLGRIDEGTVAIDAAVPRAENRVDPMLMGFAYMTRGRARLLAGKYEDAIPDLERAIATTAALQGRHVPMRAGPLAMLGVCQWHLGRTKAAAETLAKIDALPEIHEGYAAEVAELRGHLGGAKP